MQPRTIAILAAAIPIIAINLVYIISVSADLVPACIPYLEGCTSISRAARRGDSIFIFRALMLPFTVILFSFWFYAYHWLKELGDTESIRPFIMLILGVIGCVALLVYVDFLGTEGKAYQLLRRYGIINFYVFSSFAELLLASRLYAPALKALPDGLIQLRKYLFINASALIICGFINIAIHIFVSDKEQRFIYNNILEWNTTILISLFCFLIYLCWRKSSFKILFSV